MSPQLTGGHTSGFSQNAARTALDEILFSVEEQMMIPDELDVNDPTFFPQQSIDREAFIFEEWSDVGLFERHREQEEIRTTNVRTGNKKTIEVRKYIKSVPVSAEMREDDIHGTVGELVRNIGRSMFKSRTENSILDTYGDAFDGNTFTAPDGNSLANNAHTMLSGDTLDNLETGTLTPANLETAVRSLELQIGHDGERAGHNFAGLLVPRAKYFDALEIMESQPKANTAENNLNVFLTKFGTAKVKSSGYLDSDFNSGSNAATGYHVVSDSVSVMRKVHVSGPTTDFIEPRYSRTDSWEYRARYREVAFPSRSGIGSVHSTGA